MAGRFRVRASKKRLAEPEALGKLPEELRECACIQHRPKDLTAKVLKNNYYDNPLVLHLQINRCNVRPPPRRQRFRQARRVGRRDATGRERYFGGVFVNRKILQ